MVLVLFGSGKNDSHFVATGLIHALRNGVIGERRAYTYRLRRGACRAGSDAERIVDGDRGTRAPSRAVRKAGEVALPPRIGGYACGIRYTSRLPVP